MLPVAGVNPLEGEEEAKFLVGARRIFGASISNSTNLLLLLLLTM